MELATFAVRCDDVDERTYEHVGPTQSIGEVVRDKIVLQERGLA